MPLFRLNRDALAALVATVLVTASAAQMQAQGSIGVIVGANYSTLKGVKSLDQRDGTMGGISLVLPMGGSIALQPELLLVTKGATTGGTSGTSGVKLNYAEVPVLLRVGLAKGSLIAPHVYAGPYLGLKVDCTVQGTNSACDDVPGISTKTVDVGGIAGGGLDLTVSGLVLTAGVRYDFGVSKVIEFNNANVRESAKNGTFALYAGVAVRFGR
jgi:Outer membrane protein beta-barrel domain